MVKVIRFVSKGRKAGKTSLIKGLIPKLNALGLKVAVVKHAHSGITLSGDSGEAFEAGALKSMAVSEDSITINVRVEDAEGRVTELISEFLSDSDVVLAEGFKWVDEWPAVLILRSGERVEDALRVVKGDVVAIVCSEGDVDRVREEVNCLGLEAEVIPKGSAADMLSSLIANQVSPSTQRTR